MLANNQQNQLQQQHDTDTILERLKKDTATVNSLLEKYRYISIVTP